MKSVSRNRLSAAVRSALLLSLLPIAAVQAQEEARELDRIEVTGSRIKKAEIEGQTPVTTLTREDIARTGLTSVGDIVQQITGAGSSLNTRFNSSGNFGFPPDGSGVGAGSATVSLRHLEAKRTLVLVDGIRWVNEASASGVSAATDLNTIPVSIIERIEVLEDGASSIYGSDAIGGVVNIITRRDYDGASASVYWGDFDAAGGETKAGELSFGGTGDRHSFFLSASYNEQDGVDATEYEHASVPVPGTGLSLASSATPQGRFIFVDPSTGTEYDITTPNGQLFPNGPAFPGDFIPFSTPSRFNFALDQLLLTPNERKSVFGQARFDVSDNVSWYVRTLYNQRESLNRAAPEPIFLGPGFSTGNPYTDFIVISADNPYNPFGFDLDARDGGNLIGVGRRPVEGGPRRFYQDVDTWYFGTGLEGAWDIGSRTFLWDVNYVRSSNQADQTNFGSYNARRIALALGPVAACNADPQCVPLDIFSGVGSITPAMLNYIQPVIRDSSENNLQILSANITGDLFQMPAGALAFAAGVEHRKLDGRYDPDALTVAGEYNGVPSTPTQGSYDVDEFYTELSVPIYAASETNKLDLSLAGRYSDYSTFGGETTGKLGVRWQLSDQFLLRSTFAEGFRAPSIGELFGLQSRFDATISDPCMIEVDGTPADPAFRANCQTLGVAEGTQELQQQYSVITGGNPLLEPENADSFSAGFVFSPAFAAETAWSERLDVEVTYYKHEIEGAIRAFDPQTAVDLCVETLDPALCGLVIRGQGGYIQRVEAQLENLGEIETDGFDVDLFWTLPAMDWGQLRLTWQNSFVNDYEAVSAGGVRQPQGPGIETNDSAIPEWTSNASLEWTYGDFFASWTARHISDLTEQCNDAAAFPVCRDPILEDGEVVGGTNRLGSTTFHDMQMGWRAPWFEGTQLSLGVNNAFSKDPPICLSCSLNGYDASAYDVPAGRFMYAKAEVKF